MLEVSTILEGVIKVFHPLKGGMKSSTHLNGRRLSPHLLGPMRTDGRGEYNLGTRGVYLALGSIQSFIVKRNLAHKFMVFYLLCLSFHFDISNMLKAKNIRNTG